MTAILARTRRHATLRIAGLLLAWVGLPGAAAALEFTQAGPESILFDQRTQACDPSDLPDAPARAFRNADGEIILFAPNFRNRAFTGPDLRHLTKDCAVRFTAAGSAEPELLDDRSWLHGFFTTDGQTIFAFASASFIPYRHNMACDAGAQRTDCWRNGIAALLSDDGGKTFRYQAPPPRHLVLKPENAYRPDIKNPESYISTTNIVEKDGDLYTILWRRAVEGRDSRNCLARAPKGNLDTWEVWTGDGFAPAATRGPEGWTATGVACARIGPPGLPSIRSLVRHAPSGTFIGVFQKRGKDGQPDGFYAVTSPDLLTWSGPQLVAAVPLRQGAENEGTYSAYPSVIDETSTDRNCGTVGATADLVYVRLFSDMRNGKPKRMRELVALPLRIAP